MEDAFTAAAASSYEHRRLLAFSLAGEGDVGAALGELAEASRAEWPVLEAYAADVACVHLISGAPRRALAALSLGARGGERLPRLNRALIALCVEADRSLWRRAIATTFEGGRVTDRARAVLGVVRAMIFARPLVLVPVLVTRDVSDSGSVVSRV